MSADVVTPEDRAAAEAAEALPPAVDAAAEEMAPAPVPDAALTAWTDRDSYAPGDTVTVYVDVTAEKDLAAAALRADLPAGLLWQPEGKAGVTSERLDYDLAEVSASRGSKVALSFTMTAEARDLNVVQLGLWADDAEGAVETEVEVRRTFEPATTRIPVTGGELASGDGRVTVRFPEGAADQALAVTYRALGVERLSSAGDEVVLQFELNAATAIAGTDEKAADGVGAAVTRFEEPLELRVDLTGLAGFRQLAPHQFRYLRYFDEATQEWVPVDCEELGDVLVATVDHFTEFEAGIGTIVDSGWTLSPNEATVALFDGGLSYSYPLAVPDGTGGLQPDLTLTYSSRRVDGIATWKQADWAGLGWSIDNMEIVRDVFRPKYVTTTSNPDGDPAWTDRDVQWGNFYSLLYQGTRYELTPATPNARGRYYTTDDQFLYVERRSNFGSVGLNGSPDNDTSEYWVVRLRDGTEYRLGYNEDSEQVFESKYSSQAWPYPLGFDNDSPESFIGRDLDSKRVAYRWRVDRVRDQQGNVMEYSYEEEETNGGNNAFRENASYLSEIRYNPYGTDTWLTRIRFEREHRSGSSVADGYWNAADAYLFQSDYLDEVTVENWNSEANPAAYEVVRQYRFTYSDYQPSEDTSQHIRMLAGITEYGQGATTALPTTVFTYTAAANKVQCSGCEGDWRNLSFAYPRLAEITNGYGATTTVTYETPDAPKASDYKYDRTYNYRVVTSTTASGLGGGSQVVYSYPTANSGRAYQLNTTTECDFYASGVTTGGTLIGYRAVTETLQTLAGSPLAVTGHFFTLDIVPEDQALRGLEQETRQYDTLGVMLAKTVMDWERVQTVVLGEGNPSDSARSAFSSYLSEVKEYYLENAGFPGDGSPQKKTVYQYILQTPHFYGSGEQTYAQVSDWSHLNRVDEYDHSTLVRRTLYEYAPNGATVNWVGQACTDLAINDPTVCPWLTNLVSQEIITGTSGTVSGTRYFYDDHATHTITPTHGILTEVQQLSADDTTWVTTQQLGYSTATVISATVTYGPTQLVDARGYTTTVAYDIARRDPVTVTNALGQMTTYEYDPILGLVTRVVGPNGAATATEYAFDEFGRLTAIVQPGDSAAYPTTAITYDDGAAPWRIVQEARQESGTAATVATATFYDGLGRALQTQVWDTARETATVTDQRYNAQGLVADSWPAYITTTLTSDYLALDDARPHTAYAYDALGRVTTATAPDGTATTTDYDGLRTAVLDADDHQTIQTYDALGRLAQVDSYSGTYGVVNWTDTVYVSSAYDYNALDLLTAVTVSQSGASDVVTTIDYDLLGNKVAMDDPDMGEWSYAYDAAGNLVRQEDARGQVVCLYYDALNRLTGKAYCTGTCPSSPTLAVSYSYDGTSGGNYGIGQRTAMSDTTGSTAWRYDDRGRVVAETRQVTGIGQFAQSWSYDAAGRVVTYTLPGGANGAAGEAVAITYDGLGRPATLIGEREYVADATYDEFGRLTSLDHEGRYYSAYEYYAVDEKGGRLASITGGWQGSSTATQELTYDYDTVGNVHVITDVVNSQIQTFGYDALDRLTSASAAGGYDSYSDSYAYDPLGNITNFDGVAYGYSDSAHRHAVTHLNSTSTYSYDANGNMVSRPWAGSTQTLSYDTENHLVEVDGATDATYAYDGDGQMVVATVGDQTTVYIGESYEWTAEGASSYYSFGGRKVAWRTSGRTVRYLLADQLGSTTDLLGPSHYVFLPWVMQTGFGEAEGGAAASKAAEPAEEEKDGAGEDYVWPYPGPEEPEETVTPEPTAAPTEEATPEPTAEPTATAMAEPTATAESTAEPTATATNEPTATMTATATPTATGEAAPENEEAGAAAALYVPGTASFAPASYEASAPAAPVADDPYPGPQVQSIDDEGWTQRYTPYGEQRSEAQVETDYRYTGQREEDAIGLYYYDARWYDPALGRFIQPDTIVPGAGSAQALNRYSYVLNNPMKYADPTGYAAKVSQASVSSVAARLAAWTPSRVKLPLDTIKSAAATYGVPWQVVAGLLTAEINLDTDNMDYLETMVIRELSAYGLSGDAVAQAMLGIVYLAYSNPGPGIGNIHLETAQTVSAYFAENYGDNPGMQLGLHQLSCTDLGYMLTFDSVNINVVAAYVRMLADYRFGSNGSPSLADHSDLSTWTTTDAAAIWHGYRYGVIDVSPFGSGFGVPAFQNRSLTLGLTVSAAQGAGKAESIYRSVPYFEYYFARS